MSLQELLGFMESQAESLADPASGKFSLRVALEEKCFQQLAGLCRVSKVELRCYLIWNIDGDARRKRRGSTNETIAESSRRSKSFRPHHGGAATIAAPAAGRTKVRAYIANQAEHHRKRTFREEYTTMLRRGGIEYDARYLD